MPDPSFQNSIGFPLVELQSIDSTNNYALAQIHAGLAQHGAAFFAHEQVAGRGQRGKTWIAEKDTSLITSIVINPTPLNPGQQFQLSACVAVSTCECLNQYAADNIRIKWPNDLYWHDRKAGGILIDNIIGSADPGNRTGTAWRWAVAGIGININQDSFPDHLVNPVSLKQITGKENDPIAIANELYSLLDRNWKSLINGGFGPIYDSYLQHLYKKDQVVKFKKGARSFEATIKKVSTDGRLVVQHAMEEEFTTGEVEWLM